MSRWFTASTGLAFTLQLLLLSACFQQGPLQLVFARSAALELRPHSRSGPAAAANGEACSSTCCQPAVQQVHAPSCTNATTPRVGAAETATSPQGCCKQQRDQHQEQARQQSIYCNLDPTAGGVAVAPGVANSNSSTSLPPVGGLVWELPTNSSSNSSSASPQQPLMVWLGPPSSPALTHLQLTHSMHPWLLLDPATQEAQQGMLPELQRLLKRRYYLVERTRAASMVGLLVGTLGAAGYMQALNKLRELAEQVRQLQQTKQTQWTAYTDCLYPSCVMCRHKKDRSRWHRICSTRGVQGFACTNYRQIHLSNFGLSP